MYKADLKTTGNPLLLCCTRVLFSSELVLIQLLSELLCTVFGGEKHLGTVGGD